VSERENPRKFGGRRDNIPFVLLSRQLLSKRNRKHLAAGTAIDRPWGM